jgi:REP element-mobilizing transposase RayT
MPRPPRLQAPGSLHHLIARGNERREVFRDDADRENYLERIARYRKRFGFRLYAYCLMPNHVHLAAEQGPVPLSDFMHALQSSYTQYFNRRHERVGHLFQGRYKSFLVDSERYFLALVRYIHENPVKAGIVRDARVYRWSSDRFFRSGTGAPWLDLEQALALMGSNPREARRLYCELMNSHDSASTYDLLPACERSIKGDQDFAREALRQVCLPRRRSLGWTAEAVACAVAACARVPLEDLVGSSRRRELSWWRVVSAYLGRDRLGIPVSETARLFQRNENSLANSVRSFEERIAHEPGLREQLERIARDAELRA